MKQTTFNEIQPSLLDQVKSIAQKASNLPLEEKINFLNEARSVLHEISPFKFEPIDFVFWEKIENIEANSWNPNIMGDNEKQMLVGSMRKYGMSQAIVTVQTNPKKVIDGWHRNDTGSTDPVMKERMHGYNPIVFINGGEADQREATLLFNETKGKHYIEKEGYVIKDLAELGRSDEEMSKNLGKPKEEIDRLKQITGIAARFANKEYSKAWGELDDKMEIW